MVQCLAKDSGLRQGWRALSHLPGNLCFMRLPDQKFRRSLVGQLCHNSMLPHRILAAQTVTRRLLRTRATLLQIFKIFFKLLYRYAYHFRQRLLLLWTQSPQAIQIKYAHLHAHFQVHTHLE